MTSGAISKKVYCDNCRWSSIQVYGGGIDWNLDRSCRSPKNRFIRHMPYTREIYRKDQGVLNAKNNCSFYQAASVQAIKWTDGKFAGPFEFYESDGKSMTSSAVSMHHSKFSFKRRQCCGCGCGKTIHHEYAYPWPALRKKDWLCCMCYMQNREPGKDPDFVTAMAELDKWLVSQGRIT